MHCCRSSTSAITLATCTSIAHTSSALPGVCIMWHNSCMQSWQVAKVVVVMIAAFIEMVICISLVESGLFSRQNDNQASLYQTWEMSHQAHIIKWASWNFRLLCGPWAIFTQGKFLHLQSYLYRMQSNHPLLIKNKLMLSRPCQGV